jgi:hypothetical protein
MEVEKLALFPGGVLEQSERPVAHGDTDVEMLESSYSGEGIGWIGRCHQWLGGAGVAAREVAGNLLMSDAGAELRSRLWVQPHPRNYEIFHAVALL